MVLLKWAKLCYTNDSVVLVGICICKVHGVFSSRANICCGPLTAAYVCTTSSTFHHSLSEKNQKVWSRKHLGIFASEHG